MPEWNNSSDIQIDDLSNTSVGNPLVMTFMSLALLRLIKMNHEDGVSQVFDEQKISMLSDNLIGLEQSRQVNLSLRNPELFEHLFSQIVDARNQVEDELQKLENDFNQKTTQKLNVKVKSDLLDNPRFLSQGLLNRFKNQKIPVFKNDRGETKGFGGWFQMTTTKSGGHGEKGPWHGIENKGLQGEYYGNLEKQIKKQREAFDNYCLKQREDASCRNLFHLSRGMDVEYGGAPLPVILFPLDESYPYLPMFNGVENWLPTELQIAQSIGLGVIYFSYDIHDKIFYITGHFQTNQGDIPFMQAELSYEPLHYRGNEAIWWFWSGGTIAIDNKTTSVHKVSYSGKNNYMTWDSYINYPVSENRPGMQEKLMELAEPDFSFENLSQIAELITIEQSKYQQNFNAELKRLSQTNSPLGKTLQNLQVHLRLLEVALELAFPDNATSIQSLFENIRKKYIVGVKNFSKILTDTMTVEGLTGLLIPDSVVQVLQNVIENIFGILTNESLEPKLNDFAMSLMLELLNIYAPHATKAELSPSFSNDMLRLFARLLAEGKLDFIPHIELGAHMQEFIKRGNIGGQQYALEYVDSLLLLKNSNEQKPSEEFSKKSREPVTDTVICSPSESEIIQRAARDTIAVPSDAEEKINKQLSQALTALQTLSLSDIQNALLATGLVGAGELKFRYEETVFSNCTITGDFSPLTEIFHARETRKEALTLFLYTAKAQGHYIEWDCLSMDGQIEADPNDSIHRAIVELCQAPGVRMSLSMSAETRLRIYLSLSLSDTFISGHDGYTSLWELGRTAYEGSGWSMSGGPLAQGAYNQYRPIVLKILEGVYEKTLDSVQTRNNYGSHFLNVHKAVYDINASLAHSYTGQGKASFFSSNKTSEFIPPEGLLFVPIPGDGHCFFRAVSLYLGEDVSDLRTRATDYIRANLNDFQEYFTDQNIERYLDELANTNAWADNMAISALSQALERPIAIVQSNRTELVNAELFPNGEPMFVHYDGVNHYNGLTLTDTDSLSAESIMANIEVNQSFSNYSL